MLPAAPFDEDATADSGALFHLGVWGGIAAACLLVVAIVARTETGHARLSAAYASLTGNTQDTQVEDRRKAERERQAEDAERIAETIRNLTEDRDRLLTRMSALERNYEDVTGSIGKLAKTAKPAAELTPVPPAEAAAAGTPPPPPVASAPPPPAPTAAPVASAVASVPVTAEPAEPAPARGEFGVDVGGAPTVASLRTAWDRIRRNHAAVLEGMRPLIAVRDGRSGQVELRLIVGPIGNAATATKICASLAASGLSCQPTMFEGQRLAVR